jgi:hypothetical protein
MRVQEPRERPYLRHRKITERRPAQIIGSTLLQCGGNIRTEYRMNRTTISLIAGAAFASLAAASASAQNAPPPGNVNPGSIYSGAEESGASDQPRSPRNGWRSYRGYSYAPAYPGAYGYYTWPQGGAPVYGGGYYD